MKVRRFKIGEEDELWAIYHNTIHRINIRDYSEAQISAWAPPDLDMGIWRNKIGSINPFVVENDGNIIGYADIQPSGLIDHFYCHYQWQRQGVGSMLMKRISAEAIKLGVVTLTSEVSITAKPFYLSQRFSVVENQFLLVRGHKLANYKMQKQLTSA